MAANSRGVRTYPAPIGVLVERMRALPWSGLKYQMKFEQPIQGGVTFHLSSKVSFTSWGEDIQVTLIDQGNQTYVDIYSACSLATQVIDWGKNQENVNRIMLYLDQCLMR